MGLRALFPVGISQLMLALAGAIGIDALGYSVAVDAEGFGGVRNAFLVADEGLLNVELFEFLEGLVQKDVAVQHVFNNGF